MAKETRVGLLVGLLFIIMFGLVLGELTGTGGKTPTTSVAEVTPATFTPTPAIEDLSAPILHPHSAEPPSAAGGPPIVEASLSGPRPGGVAAVHVIPEEAYPRSVALTASVSPAGASAEREALPSATGAPPGPRTYKVQPNDSLIRIARKVYGPGKDDFYKLIHKANRDRLTDEATLSIGQELVIPPLPADARSPSGPAAGTEARPPASVPQPPIAPRRSAPGEMDLGGGEGRYVEMDIDRLQRHLTGRDAATGRAARVYVVQSGDSLTVIARKFLHDDSAAAVRRIFEANRDQLRSPDRLQVGMKLQIPS